MPIKDVIYHDPRTLPYDTSGRDAIHDMLRPGRSPNTVLRHTESGRTIISHTECITSPWSYPQASLSGYSLIIIVYIRDKLLIEIKYSSNYNFNRGEIEKKTQWHTCTNNTII